MNDLLGKIRDKALWDVKYWANEEREATDKHWFSAYKDGANYQYIKDMRIIEGLLSALQLMIDVIEGDTKDSYITYELAKIELNLIERG